MAALQTCGESTIIEKLQTRDHTERMLKAFGGEIYQHGRTIQVMGKPQLTGQNVTVPGDMSSAAFFLTAAALLPGSEVTLKNVGLNPTRTGFLDVLKRMGASVDVLNEKKQVEPSGDLRVRHAHLKAIHLSQEEIPSVIDELPLVALLATQAKGTTTITGAEELRVKETDRIAVVAEELTKLGARIEELPDGLIIHGQTALNPQMSDRVDTHGDHRIGMMLAVAALLCDNSLYLENEAAINISYPGFLTILSSFAKRGLRSDENDFNRWLGTYWRIDCTGDSQEVAG
ncbi:5-enolpyruvylshikimate-3-phosphate synthase [Sporolactobacillus inulinus]|uniref:5-enolpyruvylshikimate-3-phosphate synthase n=1 Tax=Sporolactobacillus inulinus TaxID=2078 RepID=A0A4Y1ZAS5_9BACL|nr:5-enolpyruvylshikimate-3-phosphate synthase [Sporolactobacillus inulinus]